MSNQRYFIFLAYRGTGYNGWQVQPGKITIQGTVNQVLSTVLQEDISCTGAGRTDTGVHASMFVAHFDSIKTDLQNSQNIIFRLNRVLPKEIAISKISLVREGAHARFDATSRTYEYVITFRKDPFSTGLSHFRQGDLDLKAMNRACKYLLEYTDFTSFSKLHTDVKTNRCRISTALWVREDDRVVFRIEADRFLRNMVRAIVGTMLDIGSGKIAPDKIKSIIEAKDRSKAGRSAKAEGLCLVHIDYPGELFI